MTDHQVGDRANSPVSFVQVGYFDVHINLHELRPDSVTALLWQFSQITGGQYRPDVYVSGKR